MNYREMSKLESHQNNIDFVQFRWQTVQDAILGIRMQRTCKPCGSKYNATYYQSGDGKKKSGDFKPFDLSQLRNRDAKKD